MTRVLGWLIAFFGVLCLILFGAGMLFFDEPPEPLKWTGGVGVAAILLWLLADWKNLARMGEDQTVGKSFTSAFATVLVLAIAVVINVAVYRYDTRWDLTATKRFSLSEQTTGVVGKLDKEVTVYAWFQKTDPGLKNFRALMEEYTALGTLLKVEYHDPYEDRMLAEEQKILSTAGTVILKAGEREQRIEGTFNEEAVTNALVRVNSEKQHVVCASDGHGELDIDDDQTAGGMGIAKLRLEGQSYKFEKRSLLDNPPTPADCELVVVAGPRSELLPVERDRLAKYVAGGGKLMVLMDPLTTPETAADLARYGIKVGNDVVIEGDPNRQTEDGPTAVMLDPSSFDFSPITEKIKGYVELAMVRSVGKGTEIPGINVQELARSSEQSWAETTLDPKVPMAPDAETDTIGRVPVFATAEVSDPGAVSTVSAAAAVVGLAPDADLANLPTLATPKAPEADIPAKAGGRVAVFGDSEFAGNLLITRYYNQDLLFNTIAWLIGQEDEISIRANETKSGQLDLSLLSLIFSGGLMLLVVPGVTIAAAAVNWMRRRSQ